MKIPIARTAFTKRDLQAIVKPLRSGWVVQGPHVREFEEKWSRYTGAKHSIAVSSCTTALHLSLAALGIGRDDEVIVPSFTWVATANAVEALGAKAVLCDIDLRTFNIDTARIEERLTSHTRAIIPVHLFGLAAEMDAVMTIARKHNLFVVEDAACGFAARYKGIHVGRTGNTGCFSFHPRKAITTGEGGMITTDDDALAAKLSSMRDHGASVSDLHRHAGPKPYLLPEFPYLGYNYRMTDIQGSIGSTQMDRADKIHKARARWAVRYDEVLGTLPWLRTPFRDSGYTHGFQAYVCLFEPERVSLKTVGQVRQERNAFMEYLQGKGISTRPGTHAVHCLQYYVQRYGLKPEDLPNAFLANECSIAFPLFPTMTENEFKFIARAIRGYKV